MKRGVVDLVVLALIARGGVSGVDLVDELDGLFPPGTIYPALARLERNGRLVATFRRASTGRKRKEYDLSGSGTDDLAQASAEWSELRDAVDRVLEGLPIGT